MVAFKQVLSIIIFFTLAQRHQYLKYQLTQQHYKRISNIPC
jgi:hypothetical protein